jgi:hypothetical protein
MKNFLLGIAFVYIVEFEYWIFSNLPQPIPPDTPGYVIALGLPGAFVLLSIPVLMIFYILAPYMSRN